MLRSVFGSVPYLERLTQRIARVSGGNPAHCLEIAQHLIATGAAVYADGAWTLPTDIDAAGLPSRGDAYLARVWQLPETTRQVASAIGIEHSGTLSEAQCAILAERELDATREALATLCQVGVLRAQGDGYTFVHEDVRRALVAALPAQQQRAAHSRLARSVAEHAGDQTADLLLSGLHYLYAGELEAGVRMIALSMRRHGGVDAANLLRPILPLVERVYSELKKLSAPVQALADCAALLAIGGYYVDRRFGAYGDEALAVNARVLSLDSYFRWRGYIGDKPALLLALVRARFMGRSRKVQAAPIPRAVSRFISVASSLNALAATAADSQLAARYAEAIAPFAALGADHVARLAYDFARFIARQSGDRVASYLRDANSLRARLLATPAPRGMTPALAKSYLTGLDVVTMLLECWRETPEALTIADRVEGMSPLHGLYADANRASYFVRFGDLERAEQVRRRIEVHAVELGSAWQVETWGGLFEAVILALQTHDALRMKRAIQSLERVCPQLPSLNFLLRRACGFYYVLQGDYARAIPLLEADEEPLAMCGWAQARGVLAHAHNELGQHGRAKEVCEAALALLEPDDLDFVALNLGVQIECAVARAALGEGEAAARELDALIERHAERRGPLTLGALHEGRARVALHAGEEATCRVHVDAMTRYFRPLGLFGLRQRIERLERRLPGSVPSAPLMPLAAAEQLLSTLEPLSDRAQVSTLERAQQCIQIALDVTGASDGFLVLWLDERKQSDGTTAPVRNTERAQGVGDLGASAYKPNPPQLNPPFG